MKNNILRTLAVILLSISVLISCTNQDSSTNSVKSQTAPTKMEGFKPTAGSLVTKGYDSAGDVAGISLEVREVKNNNGINVKGIRLKIREAYNIDKIETAFVDADEVSELIKGIDEIIEVKSNPTTYGNFEVSYRTRGDLVLTAFNNDKGIIEYVVNAGRIDPASRGLTIEEMQKLKELFIAAQEKLNSQSIK